ncbi:MAG: hypothetical protein JXL84_17880 [Deltaproteobacteria bacterium]|nr:hypothetical protein [Deltaproteobacteria bacterium]
MRIPEAHLVHRSLERLRLRIPSRRGNAAFFSRVEEKLSSFPRMRRLEVNPATGSLLFLGKSVDLQAIARVAQKEGLFTLQVVEQRPVSLPKRIAAPLGGLSSKVRRMTGGHLDLPGLAFLSLLGFGLFQILRGDLRSPPWYTAFWYAFGVFSKSVADMMADDDGE